MRVNALLRDIKTVKETVEYIERTERITYVRA